MRRGTSGGAVCPARLTSTRYFYRRPTDASRPPSGCEHLIAAIAHRDWALLYLPVFIELSRENSRLSHHAPIRKGDKKKPKTDDSIFLGMHSHVVPHGQETIDKLSRGTKSLVYQRFKRASTRSPQRMRKPLASPVRPLLMAFRRIGSTVLPGQATARQGTRAVAQSTMQESRLLSCAISQAPETARDRPPRDVAWLAALSRRVGQVRLRAEPSKTKDDEFLPTNRRRGYGLGRSARPREKAAMLPAVPRASAGDHK